MRRIRALRPAILVCLSLVLVVLANLGLTVHTGHHSLGAPGERTAVQLLASHSEPDTTLHLENVSEVRTLTCPGCVLQHQIGGGHLLAPDSVDAPVVVGSLTVSSAGYAASPKHSARTSRGPPSC